MENVISEREFDTPMTEDRYMKIGEDGASCFDLYRVTFRGSYLSLDGSRLVCAFLAPDAQALRNVGRDMNFPAKAVWSATCHHPPSAADRAPAGLQTVLVERSFPEPASVDELQAREDAKAWCLDTHRVTFLKTYFSFDRKRMLCLYAAPDAEAVRRVQETTELPYDRVWAASTIGWDH